MEKTRITVLCENRSSDRRNLMGEHGFSALIETDFSKTLLDTGQGMTLASNARTLGIDLSQIETVVISHGHFDHTGGLTDIFPPNPGIRVIGHPEIFRPRYSRVETRDGPVFNYIGIQQSQRYLESHFQTPFTFYRDFTQLSTGIWFSGQVPRVTDFEKQDEHLKIATDKGYETDPVVDDISLLVETASGPVIVTGCAHAGIVNIIRHFEQKTGHRKFFGIIGGTHLGFIGSQNQLDQSMQAFESYGFDLVAAAHCTGNAAAAAMRHRFKDKFAFANAGWQVTL